MSESAANDHTCLHLVVAAGDRAHDDCLAHCGPGDTILFLDQGVLHLLNAAAPGSGEPGPTRSFAAADLEAHGLLARARAAGVNIVDDADFARLLAAHRHCLTWS